MSDLLVAYLYFFLYFFFNDTATTEIYTLSLHDALPISKTDPTLYRFPGNPGAVSLPIWRDKIAADRKSTRLNSSHSSISYAVFCLKKKTKKLKINNNPITHINIHKHIRSSKATAHHLTL